MRVGQAEIEVRSGDISSMEVDAIVNAANNHLWMGAGVAGAIKRAGGEEIEREAISLGPIAVGEAVSTRAGRLPARWVIHAAVMGQDLRTDATIIDRATRSTLRVAEDLGARSVALPAFGTGVGGFSLDECARIMVGACAAHLRAQEGMSAAPSASARDKTDGSSLRLVVFAVFGAEAAAAFEAAVAAQSTSC